MAIELDQEALSHWLSKRWPGAFTGIHNISQFDGGYSNLTFLLDLGDRKVVLRIAPKGAQVKGGHDMLREFRILSTLSPHLPECPTPLLVCEDSEVLGSPFFIMEFVEGTILRPGTLPKNMSPEGFQNLCHTLIDGLAQLHNVRLSATDIDSIGKPEGYQQRQVTGWIGRYRKVKANIAPEVEQLCSWLESNIPDDQRVSLIHNDFKFDNVVMDLSGGGGIKAILDWEMATVGHPWMDLGTSLAYWVEAKDGPYLKPFNISHLPGALTRQEVLEYYQQKTGSLVRNPVFYYVFGLLKVATIVQQIFFRYENGLTNNPKFASLGIVGDACIQQAIVAVDRMKV